jgi:hypothetical protein
MSKVAAEDASCPRVRTSTVSDPIESTNLASSTRTTAEPWELPSRRLAFGCGHDEGDDGSASLLTTLVRSFLTGREGRALATKDFRLGRLL